MFSIENMMLRNHFKIVKGSMDPLSISSNFEMSFIFSKFKNTCVVIQLAKESNWTNSYLVHSLLQLFVSLLLSFLCACTVAMPCTFSVYSSFIQTY